jgi:hypothetical protein
MGLDAGDLQDDGVKFWSECGVSETCDGMPEGAWVELTRTIVVIGGSSQYLHAVFPRLLQQYVYARFGGSNETAGQRVQLLREPSRLGRWKTFAMSRYRVRTGTI